MPQFAVLHITPKLRHTDFFDLSAPQSLKDLLQDQIEMREKMGVKEVNWENDRCRLTLESCRSLKASGVPIHELLGLITTGTGWSLTHVAADKYTDRYIFEKK